MRSAEVNRKTNETNVDIFLELDGDGEATVDTGVGFFDHMLELFAFHGSFDLHVKITGDLDVDDHHSIEDCGIALGNAFKEALGEKRGITRYGAFTIPMDESLATVNLDISGRPYLVFNCEFTRENIGMMATEMVEEFFRAFAMAAGITLHINLAYGKNDHHKAEAIFKACARALKEAVTVDGYKIPSTKGYIE